MHTLISRYFFYYPTVFLKREPVAKLLKQYRASQYWSPAELASFQARHLKQLVEAAASGSPFYKERLEAVDLSSPTACMQSLASISPLTKKDLVENSEAIVSRRSFLDDVKTTGGSTGQAVQIRKNSYSLGRERAATWRAYEWAGVTVGDAQARFWGVPLAQQNRLKFKVVDFISNRIRLSAFNMTDESLENYHHRVLTFQPTYLYGYVSAIREYLSYLHRKKLSLPRSTRSIITTSEVLTKEIRQELEGCSGLRVFNEYGCGEVGSIAHECEQGSLHIMAENLIVEIDSSGPGGTGELVVTDLHNTVTPLIRYRLGDYGSLSSRNCACGRTLPLIENIHGRAYDLIILPDGRKIHPELLMYVFEELKSKSNEVLQFQVLQSATDRLAIKLVTTINCDRNSIEAHLKNRISEVLQSTPRIEFEYVPAIQREPSGKMRVIKRLFE